MRMSKTSSRIRCLICNNLVQREVSSIFPYAVRTLTINNKRGCFCSFCIENYYSYYTSDLRDYEGLTKKSTLRDIAPSFSSPTSSNGNIPNTNPPYVFPTSDMLAYTFKQMFPIPVSIVPSNKVSTKHSSHSKTPEDEVNLIKKKYACLDYSLDSYFSIVTSKVFGQNEAAKMLLYTIYYNQFANLLEETGISQDDIKKNHIVLIGNTGVGKSFLCTTVAETLKIPYALCNSTSITSAGYVGGKVEDFLVKLYLNAGQNIEIAENGILFIDEIDKKRVSPDKSGRDVNGRAVQEEMLKLLEPSVIHLKEYNIDFNTKNLTIIMAGAFVGLDEVIKKRLNKKVIGFRHDDTPTEKAEVLPSDLIEYGLIPEFIGRVPAIISMNPLIKSVITDIIYSALNKVNIIFKVKNFDLIINEFYIDYIADEILKSSIGARDVHSKIFNILQPALYRIFQCEGGGICQIDATGKIEIITESSKKSMQLYEYDSKFKNEEESN